MCVCGGGILGVLLVHSSLTEEPAKPSTAYLGSFLQLQPVSKETAEAGGLS